MVAVPPSTRSRATRWLPSARATARLSSLRRASMLTCTPRAERPFVIAAFASLVLTGVAVCAGASAQVAAAPKWDQWDRWDE